MTVHAAKLDEAPRERESDVNPFLRGNFAPWRL